MESAVIKRLPAQHRAALRGNIHVKKVHKVYRVCTSRYIKQEKEVPSKYNPEQFLSKCTYFHSPPLLFLLLIIIFKFCLFLSVLSHNERETVGGRLAYVKAALPTLSSCFYSSQNNKKKDYQEQPCAFLSQEFPAAAAKQRRFGASRGFNVWLNEWLSNRSDA